LSEDQINSLWRYRLQQQDLPERLIKRARRKREEKLDKKREKGVHFEEQKEPESL
jgi:hypothetical protein